MEVLLVGVACVVPAYVLVRAARALRGTAAGSYALRESTRSRRAWLVVGVATAAALLLGVPFAYVELGREDAPPPLAFSSVDSTRPPSTLRPASRPAVGLRPPVDVLTGLTTPFLPPAPGTAITLPAADSTTTTTSTVDLAPSELDGRWVVGGGSIAGYRVEETVIAQGATTAGRTTAVTGEMLVRNAVVDAASFVVDMNTVSTGNPPRDAQFRGRIMDTGRYSTARLALTQPVSIGEVPPLGQVITRTVTGTFTIRGQTREVTFELEARRVGERIEVLGNIPIRWADYGIPDPSNSVARVADNGLIEFLLYLDRAT